jgi:serine-type D-Ala-D-Ala carboxypeptidase/endopeptidase
MRIARPVPTGDDLAAIGRALTASLSIDSRLAAGHDGSRRPATPWRFDALAGAVGLIGSISSVGRFIQAAVGLRETPLAEAFAVCLRHRVESTHPLHPFGLAWEVSTIVAPKTTRVLYNQDGATAGFSSSLWIEPAQRRGAAVLANAFIETRSLALQALDASIDEDAFNRTLLPTSALVPLEGQYAALDRGHVVSVKMTDAGLWLQGAGQPAFEMLPITARRFFIRESAVEIEFGAGETPRQLLVFHNEQAMLYRRVP